MKKYVKPDLCYESFELSQNIANCGLALNHTENTCKLAIGPTILFANANNECNMKAVDGDITKNGEYYCYWTGDASDNIFTS